MRAPVRARLQAATADIHEALHSAPPFARIAAGTTDRGSYVALLHALHRYHAVMAASCAAGAIRLGAPALATSHGNRLAALRRDLQFFNRTPDAEVDTKAADPDFAVGCLYTVQGSTLGGKVIHGQLASLLPDGCGRTFFAGHGDDGAQWRLFCEKLEADAMLDLAQVVAGARHAFIAFDRLLQASGVAAEPV